MDVVGAGIVMSAFGLGIAGFVFWLIALIDCASNTPEKDRVAWLLIIVFAGWLGALIYFFAQRPKQQLAAEQGHYEKGHFAGANPDFYAQNPTYGNGAAYHGRTYPPTK